MELNKSRSLLIGNKWPFINVEIIGYFAIVLTTLAGNSSISIKPILIGSYVEYLELSPEIAGYILTAPTEYDIEVGELLEVQLGDNWRRSGQVLSRGVLNGQTWLFAVLPNDTQSGTDLRVKSQPDIIVTTQALPYSLDA